MASKLHMTVPKHFRRNSRIPGILILHRADLAEGDLQEMQGVRVTRPLRTILDLLHACQVDPRLIRQPIDDAMQRGLVSSNQTHSLPLYRIQHSFSTLFPSPPSPTT